MCFFVDIFLLVIQDFALGFGVDYENEGSCYGSRRFHRVSPVPVSEKQRVLGESR